MTRTITVDLKASRMGGIAKDRIHYMGDPPIAYVVESVEPAEGSTYLSTGIFGNSLTPAVVNVTLRVASVEEHHAYLDSVRADFPGLIGDKPPPKPRRWWQR